MGLKTTKIKRTMSLDIVDIMIFIIGFIIGFGLTRLFL